MNHVTPPCECGCCGDSLALEATARHWLHNAVKALEDHGLPEDDVAYAQAAAQIAEAAETLSVGTRMRDVNHEVLKIQNEQTAIMRGLTDKDTP